MTTIVYDPSSKVIAYDSQVTLGSVIFSLRKDKRKTINGYEVFVSGNAYKIYELLKDLPEVYNNRASSEIGRALVVSPDKEVLFIYWDSEGDSYIEKIEEPFAIGSGCEFALGALHSGCTAKRAVEIAIELDIYSGGKVNIYRIGQ